MTIDDDEPGPEHVHDYRFIREERAPTGPPPAHTKFFVLGCSCRMVRVFPWDNFQLTTEDFKTSFLSDLFAMGLTLDPY